MRKAVLLFVVGFVVIVSVGKMLATRTPPPSTPLHYPLDSLPYLAWTGGLPISGATSVRVDARLVGVANWTEAEGVASITCSACRVGDDRTSMQTRKRPAGIPFGHLDLEPAALTASFFNGSLFLRADLRSPDFELRAAAHGTTARVLGETRIEGCVQFRPLPSLKERDPATYAMVTTTGASRDANGWFTIALGGTIDAPVRIAAACTAD